MHIIHRLYSEEFDFPPYEDEPSKTVMVATMPRSGSTFFVESLWKTGRLGSPMEYASIRNRWKLYERFGSEDWCDYWRKLQRLRTSPNGVFGYKMFVSNWLEISRKQPELFKKVTSTHIVYLTREDLLGQAISQSRAMQSEAWFSGVNTKKEIQYNDEHITACMRAIQREKSVWENVFKIMKADVCRVSYEQFLADQSGVLRSIADFVGVDLDKDAELGLPFIGVQRDAITEEWRARYLGTHDYDRMLNEKPAISISPDFELIPRPAVAV